MTTPSTTPFVSIQIGAVSFVDEGVNQVLDILQQKGRVNALLLANPTWTRGTGGRQVPGQPFPDHGKQARDQFHGGAYNRINPQYYGKTAISPAFGHTDPEIPQGWDFFEAVLPEAQKRGMKSYAWMEESSNSRDLHNVPNFRKALEVDVWGRTSNKPCFNNPDYRYWILGRMEDYARSWPLDGIVWCSERTGPLNHLIGNRGRYRARDIACFCEHCQEKARRRGYAPERAIAGYRALFEWYERAMYGGGAQRPSDGYFVTFWRTLLEYPEILAWEKLWTDSQHSIYAEIYGVVKAIRREVQVGWHVMHHNSFSPFYRAEQDYQKMAPYSDFIKVVAYHNCAGPRYARFHQTLSKTIWHDARPEATLELMYGILGVDEAPLDELAKTGWSPDYVRRETERAVANVEAAGYRTAILPGIDIDIPTGEGQATCTPEGTRDAVLAALKGGARGVILSRKYSEMRLANLFAVKDALGALPREKESKLPCKSR